MRDGGDGRRRETELEEYCLRREREREREVERQ